MLKIFIRTHPKDKSINQRRNKIHIINEFIESFNKCLDKVKNDDVEVVICASGYKNREHAEAIYKDLIEQNKDKNIYIEEISTGDGQSQNDIFIKIKNDLSNDKYNSFFITEDDYIFDRMFLNRLISKIEKHKDVIFSPFSPIEPFHRENGLLYITNCYVNFAGHKDIFGKIVDEAIASTSNGNNCHEQKFHDDVWCEKYPFDHKVKLAMIDGLENKHNHY
jgi:hypothetical protein